MSIWKSIVAFFKPHTLFSNKINFVPMSFFKRKYLGEIDRIAVFNGINMNNWQQNIWPEIVSVVNGEIRIDYYWSEVFPQHIRHAIYHLYQALHAAGAIGLNGEFIIGVSDSISDFGKYKLYLLDVIDSGFEHNPVEVVIAFDKIAKSKLQIEHFDKEGIQLIGPSEIINRSQFDEFLGSGLRFIKGYHCFKKPYTSAIVGYSFHRDMPHKTVFFNWFKATDEYRLIPS